MPTIISPLFSLLLFTTLLLCHCSPSTPCPAIIRPLMVDLNFSCVCLLQCVFPLNTCFNADCVCLCIILRCLNISGLTDALSPQKPFLECHLISVSTYTPPHKHTQPPPLQVPDSLLDLLCPNSRSWQGECPPPLKSISFCGGLGRAKAPWCL